MHDWEDESKPILLASHYGAARWHFDRAPADGVHPDPVQVLQALAWQRAEIELWKLQIRQSIGLKPEPLRSVGY